MTSHVKDILDSIGLKVAFVLHFIFEFAEEVLNQPVGDLIQNTTSLLAMIFTILKSIETYHNIQAKKHTNITKNEHNNPR